MGIRMKTKKKYNVKDASGHVIVLLYKYDKKRPDKNVNMKNKTLNMRPLAGNIFKIKPEDKVIFEKARCI